MIYAVPFNYICGVLFVLNLSHSTEHHTMEEIYKIGEQSFTHDICGTLVLRDSLGSGSDPTNI